MNSTITVAELRAHPSALSLLVDVRSGSEFAAGHIPEAVNIPMDQIEARLDDLHYRSPHRSDLPDRHARANDGRPACVLPAGDHGS